LICVRLVDPLEERLPRAGRIAALEPWSVRRLELDCGSRAVREAWAEAARARRRVLASVTSRARVDCIDLYTDRDLADPLVRLFRQRERRGGQG